MFDEELREQLELARRALAAAREAGDPDGVQAYQGRIAELLRTAEKHGLTVAHSPGEESGED
jgi:hypothetical protein